MRRPKNTLVKPISLHYGHLVCNEKITPLAAIWRKATQESCVYFDLCIHKTNCNWAFRHVCFYQHLAFPLLRIVRDMHIAKQARSRFLRRFRSHLARSLSKERVRSDLRRLKNRLQDPQ